MNIKPPPGAWEEKLSLCLKQDLCWRRRDFLAFVVVIVVWPINQPATVGGQSVGGGNSDSNSMGMPTDPVWLSLKRKSRVEQSQSHDENYIFAYEERHRRTLAAYLRLLKLSLMAGRDLWLFLGWHFFGKDTCPSRWELCKMGGNLSSPGVVHHLEYVTDGTVKGAGSRMWRQWGGTLLALARRSQIVFIVRRENIQL